MRDFIQFFDESFFHLIGGFVGKGHRQYLFESIGLRSGEAEMEKGLYQGARLSRAGRRLVDDKISVVHFAAIYNTRGIRRGEGETIC